MSATAIEEIELSERRVSFGLELEDVRSLQDGLALPPVDRGFGAWSFLLTASLVEAIVWGFPETFGVFLAYYINDPRYSNQKNATYLLPIIGNLCTGLMYFSGLIVYPMMSRYPFTRRYLTWFGTLLCCVSLLGASYTRSVTVLVLLQGILYAVGGSILYAPCISYTSEWFVEKRGFANGVIFAGTALGGLVFPLVLPIVIDQWGVEKTLRALSVVILVTIGPLLYFVKGRLPDSRVHGPSARSSGDRAWMKNPVVWTFTLINTLQSLAYFIPMVWIPTFATSMGLSSSKSSLTVALLYGSSFFSRLAMGLCADRYNPWMLSSAMMTASSLSVFLFWGVLSKNLGGLVAFGLVYGLIAGGWSSLWNGFLKPITKSDPVLTTTLLNVLMVSRGLGSTLSTPITTALIRDTRDQRHSWKVGFQVDGGRYEQMIVYVGSCFAAAAAVSTFGWATQRHK